MERRATYSPTTVRKGSTHREKVRGACEMLKFARRKALPIGQILLIKFGGGPNTRGAEKRNY